MIMNNFAYLESFLYFSMTDPPPETSYQKQVVFDCHPSQILLFLIYSLDEMNKKAR